MCREQCTQSRDPVNWSAAKDFRKGRSFPENRWTGGMKVLSDNIQHSDRKEFRWSEGNEGTGLRGCA